MYNSGGSVHGTVVTEVKKVEGDLEQLRSELNEFLFQRWGSEMSNALYIVVEIWREGFFVSHTKLDMCLLLQWVCYVHEDGRVR